MILVPDTNTLIYLAKTGMLNILDKYEVWIGNHVYKETVEAGKQQGKRDAYLLEEHIQENFKRKEVDKKEFKKEMKYFNAPGETDAYLIAREKDAEAVTTYIIARKKIKRRGVDVIQTDMLLFKHFKTGEITEKELNEKLIQLRSVGGTTDERINFLMGKARKGGEEND